MHPYLIGFLFGLAAVAVGYAVSRLTHLCIALITLVVLSGCALPTTSPRSSTPPAPPPPPLPAAALITPADVATLATAASVASPPPPAQVLTWDGRADNWLVYSGPQRDLWTATNTITQPTITPQPGVVYGIAGASFDGRTTSVAYWPSNQVQRFVLQILPEPEGRAIKAVDVMTYTNTPDGRGMFLRLEQQFLYWQ